MKRCRICEKLYDDTAMQTMEVEFDLATETYLPKYSGIHFHEPMTETELAEHLLNKYVDTTGK